MDRRKLVEERKTELGTMIIQVLGKNSILGVGEILNGLGRVAEFRRRRKEETISFNREIVAMVLEGMVRQAMIFKNEAGGFTGVNHYRGLCHVFNGDGRCLCCGEPKQKDDGAVYCPKCEQFRPITASVAGIS